jgi:hypothetical protein
MELKITELDEYEIPENNIPINLSMGNDYKKVHFSEEPMKPMHPSIPKTNSKMVRPQTPPTKPTISYEDILNNMGMFVSDGKLHLIDRQQALKTQPQPQTQEPLNTQPPPQPQNSYIYNKYFKEEMQTQPNIRKPRTMEEYKQMLVNDYIQRQKIKQMKSTKLIMPTSNIQISNGNGSNINRLFHFHK